MQKNKIILIHNIISPHVESFFRFMSKTCDLTVLYCAEKEDNRSWSRKPKGFRYKILPNYSLKINGRDLFTYFINPTIVSELNKLSPNVIIISGWDLYAYQLAFFYAKIKKIKLVVISGSTAYEKSWRRSITLPLVKLIIRNADALVAYGRRAKDYLLYLGARSNNIFIYNHSTDVGFFRAIKANKKNYHTILYYGQIIERKGLDLLIKAYTNIYLKVPNIRLFIVGDGKYKAELIELSKTLDSKNVNFYDDPGDQGMFKYFGTADVLVLPSREEVWGLVVNMALSNGIPVIVSDAVGCADDLVINGTDGYVFKSGSVKDLTNKLLIFFENKQRIDTMKLKSKVIVSSYTPSISSSLVQKAVAHALNA